MVVQVYDYSTKVTIDGVQRQSGHSEIDFVTKQSKLKQSSSPV